MIRSSEKESFGWSWREWEKIRGFLIGVEERDWRFELRLGNRERERRDLFERNFLN